jgi:hypothetical protein
MREYMCDDPEVWKHLVRGIIERALNDYAGKIPGTGGAWSAEITENKIYRDAANFLGSQYCENMCDIIDLDISVIRSGMVERYKLIAKKTRRTPQGEYYGKKRGRKPKNLTNSV